MKRSWCWTVRFLDGTGLALRHVVNATVTKTGRYVVTHASGRKTIIAPDVYQYILETEEKGNQ